MWLISTMSTVIVWGPSINYVENTRTGPLSLSRTSHISPQNNTSVFSSRFSGTLNKINFTYFLNFLLGFILSLQDTEERLPYSYKFSCVFSCVTLNFFINININKTENYAQAGARK